LDRLWDIEGCSDKVVAAIPRGGPGLWLRHRRMPMVASSAAREEMREVALRTDETKDRRTVPQ
jgi:hypothetical protein